MAGGVFFGEGLLKSAYVNQGVGRFTKLGIPFPHFSAPCIACLEIVGGLLLLSGLMTRLIAIPFVAEMIVAILSTKISLYRSEEHTSELQSRGHLVCRLLLEKKKK